MYVLQTKFRLILCAIFLIGTSLASKSHETLYCEIFQNINFGGESLQISETQHVNNFTQLTQSWLSNGKSNVMENGEAQFHSFKLPLVSGIVCVLNACTSENFHGNCNVFKLSQKIIQSSRLKSFECSCFKKHTEDNVEPVVSDNSQLVKSLNCDEETSTTTFRNFTKNGKKIIGVGRNYIWHKTDLSKVVGSGTTPQKPIIFLKPTTSYLSEGNLIHLPKNLGIIYYELELAVVIGKTAMNVSEKDASDYVAGYALALDMTAKEILKSSISNGLPWELAKGFDGACPIGAFIPKTCVADPHDLQLSCSINGVLTQNDSTRQMIFKIPQLISYVSQYMTLEPNDVILTGTPDGFGQIQTGDIIEGFITGTGTMAQTNNLARIKFVVA